MASCTTSDEVFEGLNLAEQATQENAINFGTYMSGSQQTRAIADAVNGGVTGSITSAQALAQKRGFGVFAHYTVEKDYLGTVASGKTPSTALSGTPTTDLTSDQASATKPNFMYNQRIVGTDDATPAWSYTPVKYWPNGNSTADDQSPAAEGSVGGKVSFFAYAPYVETVGSTGITAMSAANAEGNPTITYKMPSTGAVVDLLWGTAGTNGYKAQTGSVGQPGDYIALNPTGSTEWADRPFKVNANLTKMKTEGKVEFAFKHALAKVGGSESGSFTGSGLQIILDVDNADGSESGGTYNNAETKVTVSAINIKARSKVDTNGDATADKYLTEAGNQGVLDLATGQWTIDVATATNITDGTGKAEMTHNITTAGSAPDCQLNTTIAEPTTAPATTEAGWNGLPAGVQTTTAKNVYQNEANPLVFIPGTFPELEVEITYVVRTKDANLADKYSNVSQTVKKTINFANKVQLNKQYNLLIHLGLTSVKFTATVSNWEPYDNNNNETIDAEDQQNVYLPINVQ
ncbi:MAG: hypothetical protein IJ064_01535 [Bacteroidaceae bacterium]|nr:hypothetical protein [Bacteroidaceae bacterium]